MAEFKLHTKYEPTGDQPAAIATLTDGILRGEKYQTLMGVTGSGREIPDTDGCDWLR